MKFFKLKVILKTQILCIHYYVKLLSQGKKNSKILWTEAESKSTLIDKVKTTKCYVGMWWFQRVSRIAQKWFGIFIIFSGNCG